MEVLSRDNGFVRFGYHYPKRQYAKLVGGVEASEASKRRGKGVESRNQMFGRRS